MAFLPARDISPAEVEDSIARTLKLIGPDIVRIRYSFDEDWSGDPAIYFRVLLTDAAAKPAGLGQLARRVSESLRDDLQPTDAGLIAYFSFRSAAEQREMQDPDWA
jgi:hypothetical protein